jgi:hypothetical protein
VTLAPTVVPSSVLSQLGNRIQHALRAFTPDDADALRKTARTFPMTEHYDIERTITSLGIGEALVTVLSPNGVPTPLAATRLIPPDSRMAPLTEPEIAQVVAASPLQARYGTTIDRESAHEIITARLVAVRQTAEAAAQTTASGTASGAGATVGSSGGAADPTAPYGGMTRREYEAQIRREAREAERERVRRAREAERERNAQERAARAAERQRQKTIETGIRTAGRVVTSRAGQSLLRGVFETIFGGKR